MSRVDRVIVPFIHSRHNTKDRIPGVGRDLRSFHVTHWRTELLYHCRPLHNFARGSAIATMTLANYNAKTAVCESWARVAYFWRMYLRISVIITAFLCHWQVVPGICKDDDVQQILTSVCTQQEKVRIVAQGNLRFVTGMKCTGCKSIQEAKLSLE